MADFAFTRQDETKVTETTKTVPLTCHGHSRPITHISFSALLPSPTNPTASPTSPSASTPQYYMITACKDNNPMLRDGPTGDWIGTFIGHKGAVWSARLSGDATLAATGSADFSARVWDTFSGVCVAELGHNHIVRAVAFAPDEPGGPGGGRGRLATGGMEKRVRVWDLARAGTNGTAGTNGAGGGGEVYEVCPGEHTGAIKSLVWGPDPHVLFSASDDKVLRWFDIRTPKLVGTYALAAAPTSCELSASPAGTGASSGIVSVAAGKNIYFLDAAQPGKLLKHIETEREVASVAVNGAAVSGTANSANGAANGAGAGPRRFVTGSPSDTWVHVWDWDSEVELETGRGHHGPVWTTAFSPDGGMYATGSEDGTVKLWKAGVGGYGLWR